MAICKFCKEDIKDDSIICKVCGSSLTRWGRFIKRGIPIISILLAVISWGQTFNIYNEKRQVEQEKMVEIRKNLELNKDLEDEKSMTMHYMESLGKIEIEVNNLKNTITNPVYRNQINRISNDIKMYKKPVEVIEGRRYLRINN